MSAYPGQMSDLPPYIEEIHAKWMDGRVWNAVTDVTTTPGGYGNNISTLLDLALSGGNPYTLAYSYDPTADMDTLRAVIDDFDGEVALLNPSQEWLSYADTAKTFASSVVEDDSLEIDAQVEAFAGKHAAEFDAAINRLGSTMQHNNALNSSAFFIGVAMLEADYLRQVADYRAQLSLGKKDQKAQLVQFGIESLTKMNVVHLETKKAVIQMRQEFYKLNTIAQKEYLNEELKIAIDEAKWGFNVFKEAGAVMGAISGTPVISQEPDKKQTAIGNLFTAAGLLGPPLVALFGAL